MAVIARHDLVRRFCRSNKTNKQTITHFSRLTRSTTSKTQWQNNSWSLLGHLWRTLAIEFEFEVIPIWFERLRGRRIEIIRKHTWFVQIPSYPANWDGTGCQWNFAISYEMVQLVVKSAAIRIGNWCVPQAHDLWPTTESNIKHLLSVPTH